MKQATWIAPNNKLLTWTLRLTEVGTMDEADLTPTGVAVLSSQAPNGDWYYHWKVGAAPPLILTESFCITPNTKVLTSSGPIEIRNIEERYSLSCACVEDPDKGCTEAGGCTGWSIVELCQRIHMSQNSSVYLDPELIRKYKHYLTTRLIKWNVGILGETLYDSAIKNLILETLSENER